MRKLVVITDAEPNVKNLWNHWEVQSGRIENNVLTVTFRNKSKLIIESVDADLVSDIVMSHDPSSEIVKGKLGIQSVVYLECEKDSDDAVQQLVSALKSLISE